MENPILEETFQPSVVLEFHHHLEEKNNEGWSGCGVHTYLSVHLVVLVVAVDKCYPVVILLYPALALSVPVLPSSLGWDGENAPKTRSFQYIASRALISDAKNLDRHCQSI